MTPARVKLGKSCNATANLSCFLLRLLNCFALSMSSAAFVLYVSLHLSMSFSLCSTPASRLLALDLDELLLEELDLDDLPLGEAAAPSTAAPAKSLTALGQG